MPNETGSHYYYSNGETIPLFPVNDIIAVRSNEGAPIPTSFTSDNNTENQLITNIPQYNIDVYKIKPNDGLPAFFENEETTMVNTVPVLKHSLDDPNWMLVDDKFIAKFKPEVTKEQINEINAKHDVKVIKPVGYLENGYVLQAPVKQDPMNVINVANSYYESGLTEFSHPNFIRERHREPIVADRPIGTDVNTEEENLRGTFLSKQWHLPVAKVTEAWAITKGNPSIKIAILDDGIDVAHLEFQGKVIKQFDFEKNIPDGTPKIGNQGVCSRPQGDSRPSDECHGTACAGVAIAAGEKAYGAAPNCSLIAVRTSRFLGVIQEGEMFQWVTDNGADVISCSWGPGPRNENRFPLTDSTCEALNYCTTHGRNGKGIPIFFAAGNYAEDTAFNGYTTHPSVMAIAASSSNETRSFYSNFGKEILVCAPSSGNSDIGEKRIFTTDRQGEAGYNKGNSASGDLQGNYTNGFGGTSSSTPLVAGITGLILSINPQLNWTQVREILARTADKIEDQSHYHNAPLGQHSKFHGYGRINALKAVQEAQQQ
ncbi:hypothetical protein CT694_10275 [Bacillus wiedmannii bv. thuringiensis]|nr:hypothetical protein CT694_10275 [Bacillus wiedmannii bv. thuringiensis]